MKKVGSLITVFKKFKTVGIVFCFLCVVEGLIFGLGKWSIECTNDIIQLILLNTAICAFYTWSMDNKLSQDSQGFIYIESLSKFQDKVDIEINKLRENISKQKNSINNSSENTNERILEESDIKLKTINKSLNKIHRKLKTIPTTINDDSLKLLTLDIVHQILNEINVFVNENDNLFTDDSILEMKYYKNLVLNDLIELLPNKNVIRVVRASYKSSAIVLFENDLFKKYNHSETDLFYLYYNKYKNKINIEIGEEKSDLDNEVIHNFKKTKFFNCFNIKKNVFESDISCVKYDELDPPENELKDIIMDILDSGKKSYFYFHENKNNNDKKQKNIGVAVGNNRYFKSDNCIIFTSANWNDKNDGSIATWFSIPKEGSKGLTANKDYYFVVRPSDNSEVSFLYIPKKEMSEIVKNKYLDKNNRYHFYFNWNKDIDHDSKDNSDVKKYKLTDKRSETKIAFDNYNNIHIGIGEIRGKKLFVPNLRDK